MHKLCHVMRQIGVDARLWIEDDGLRMCDEFDTVLGNGDCDPKDSIVLYPEVVTGNPLKAQRVVRWLLNKPGFFGTKWDVGESDIIVGYTPRLCQMYSGCDQLQVFEAWPKFFVPPPSYVVRSGKCHTLRKSKAYPEINGSTLIGKDSFDMEMLRDLFQKSERFFCYDADSMLPLFAAMCGCEAVVMPQFGVPRRLWVDNYPLMQFVAYGHDDVNRANLTRCMIPELLADREIVCREMVEKWSIKMGLIQ